MHDQRLFFSELLSSRLCHDLITPIGAINTGLELFDEQPFEKSPETDEILTLIHQSAATASARMGFFRSAFGSSGNGIALGDARRLTDKYFANSKMKFIWEDPFENHLNIPYWGRILMNMILWIQDCAPRGGILKIRAYQQHNLRIDLELESDAIMSQKEGKEAIFGETDLKDLTPRTVQPYLLHMLGADNKIVFEINDTQPRKLIFIAKAG